MQDHLGHCPACQDLFTELSELNRKLGTILAPIALAGTSAALHGGRHLLRTGLAAHWRAMRWHPVTVATGAAASVAVAGGMLFAVNVTPLPATPSHGTAQAADPAASSGSPARHHAGDRRGGGGGGAGGGGAGGTLTGSGTPVAAPPWGLLVCLPALLPDRRCFHKRCRAADPRGPAGRHRGRCGGGPPDGGKRRTGSRVGRGDPGRPGATVDTTVTGLTGTVNGTVAGLTETVNGTVGSLAGTAATTLAGATSTVVTTVAGVTGTVGTTVNGLANTAAATVTRVTSSTLATVSGVTGTVAGVTGTTAAAISGVTGTALGTVAGTAAR